jgi:pullulanase
VRSTITGNVTLATPREFLNGRRVWIYLPPGYDDNPGTRYPVLYMLDGQNVFDRATSFAGEWEVDETCEALISSGEIEPILVVAAANGEGSRVHEYTPWADPDFQGGQGGGGDAFLGELAGRLIPWVNARFRTLKGPANTGLAGSSLGGLMALYAGYAYPETFGRIAAISPVIRWRGHELLRFAASCKKPRSQIYVDTGALEGGGTPGHQGIVSRSITDLRALRDVLLRQGFVPGQDLLVVEDEAGRHHETFWAARFPRALRFLFPPAASSRARRPFSEPD